MRLVINQLPIKQSYNDDSFIEKLCAQINEIIVMLLTPTVDVHNLWTGLGKFLLSFPS